MSLWDKKVAGILGASPGNIGTFGAQQHLRQVLTYLNMYVMAQPEIYFNATNAFDQEGRFAKKSTEVLLKTFFDSFSDLINLVNGEKDQINPFSDSQNLEDSARTH
jgi:chromate reductase